MGLSMVIMRKYDTITAIIMIINIIIIIIIIIIIVVIVVIINNLLELFFENVGNQNI